MLAYVFKWINILLIPVNTDLLPRNLRSSCTTLRSQTRIWSLTEIDYVTVTGLLVVVGETPWCSETLNLQLR